MLTCEMTDEEKATAGAQEYHLVVWWWSLLAGASAIILLRKGYFLMRTECAQQEDVDQRVARADGRVDGTEIRYLGLFTLTVRS